jgi:hypothetical protein
MIRAMITCMDELRIIINQIYALSEMNKLSGCEFKIWMLIFKNYMVLVLVLG